ncbi:MAG: XRE family transcriptional regulator [Bacteroidetes bacterium]|nr:MAG: XRE family transcriptional regulator [Bacteroidota bacterium]
MENLTTQVLDKIRKMRDLQGIKQDEMATFLGFTQQAYSKIETGESELTLQRLEQIIIKLNTTLPQLLDFNPQSIFQNIGNNKNKEVALHVYQSPNFTPSEKNLYERMIENLEKENARLAQTVEELLKK